MSSSSRRWAPAMWLSVGALSIVALTWLLLGERGEPAGPSARSPATTQQQLADRQSSTRDAITIDSKSPSAQPTLRGGASGDTSLGPESEAMAGPAELTQREGPPSPTRSSHLQARLQRFGVDAARAAASAAAAAAATPGEKDDR